MADAPRATDVGINRVPEDSEKGENEEEKLLDDPDSTHIQVIAN